MITGDEIITEGEVYLNQFSIKRNLHQVTLVKLTPIRKIIYFL